MNILILNWRDTKHVWAGGSELYIHELARRWAEKNTVTLFCASDPEKKLRPDEVIDGVRIIRRGGRFSVYFYACYHYLKSLRKQTDFIIDVENGVPFFTPLFSRKKILSVVYHVHGKQFFYELPFPLSLVGYVTEKYIFPVIYRNIQVLAISKTTKNELHKLGFKKKNITIVFPGLGKKMRLARVEKYKRPTILYLGRIKKYKRVDQLIEVFEMIYSSNPKARLMIAGWGSEAPIISDVVMKSKLRKSIDIIGPVSESEKAGLYAKSWVFVNPSLHEGWGIAVIEANSYGTPAIAFKVPGLSDSIVDGKTGFLCKDKDAMAEKILALIEDKKLLHGMSAEAKKWADEFSWEDASQKSLKLIKRIYNQS